MCKSLALVLFGKKRVMHRPRAKEYRRSMSSIR
ncbi:Uncharacterised protein [Vibrio cholerae]|nr:Uncharacterised protein [Vibrio cholerae]